MSQHDPNEPEMSTGYMSPYKAILSLDDLATWKQSATHQRIIDYIMQLNNSIIGKKLTDPMTESESVGSVIKVLEQIESIAQDTPPVDNNASRFGNPAFKTFYDKVQEVVALPSLHAGIPRLPAEAIPEISVYLQESWGSRARIDYGSGMELNFLCWLFCLDKLGVFSAEDHPTLVLRVFWKFVSSDMGAEMNIAERCVNRYLNVMRFLQKTYWLEPAGSHGVWGLDDYHFLPFLWGSGQLVGHPHLRPKSIHNAEVIEEFSKHYIYFACIEFINSIKTASLRWHSPMLDDISGVKTWDKVNSGMVKMYNAEVLGKLPVAQHFLFGSIIPCPDGIALPSHDAANDPHWGHAHATTGAVGQSQSGWGDCCGIPVPSVFAAAQAEKEKQNAVRPVGVPLTGGNIRPVPFD
ncbi:Serine/threonine-protein phosphatase 2A activator 2 [Ceratobasidium sp. 370]|nr:Serine/threonine-protein phosphatase 2A activator 2 [Ceratobasidium sp. 370]